MTHDLFGVSTLEPATSFEDWMRRYIDHIAREAKMDRKAAEEIIRDAGEEIYRELFSSGKLPEDAADEELQDWTE